MGKNILGTYYKTEEKAKEAVKEKNKLWRKDSFAFVKFERGFLVISKKQLEKL